MEKEMSKKKSEKEKYSLMSNIVYIYKAFFREHEKWMYLVFVLRLFISLLTSSILVALPAVAVSLIERQKGAVKYLFIVFGITLVYISLRTLQEYVENSYEIRGTITRAFGFSSELVWKSDDGLYGKGVASEPETVWKGSRGDNLWQLFRN